MRKSSEKTDRVVRWRQRYTKILKRSLAVVELLLVIVLAMVAVGWIYITNPSIRDGLGIASLFEVLNLGITVVLEPTSPRIHNARRCPTCRREMIVVFEHLRCTNCGGEHKSGIPSS